MNKEYLTITARIEEIIYALDALENSKRPKIILLKRLDDLLEEMKGITNG